MQRRKSDPEQTPASGNLGGAESAPTYEPEGDRIDSSNVIVDVEEARQPKSDLAKSIAARAKGPAQVVHIKKARAGGGAIFDLNPYDLRLEPGWNLRNFDSPKRKEAIASLALSISKIGVQETLIAHIVGDNIFVHSGWNRLLATYHAIEVLGAEIRGIPVRLSKAGENEADLMLSQIINNTQSGLTVTEQGAVIKKLVGFGWEIKDIASKLGRSETSVKNLLGLQELPLEIRKLVESGTVSAYFANKAYRDAGENDEAALLTLRSAMENAAAKGATRVLPMHAAGAERKPRTSRGGGGRKRAEVRPPATIQEMIPALVVALRDPSVTWEKDAEGNGRILVPRALLDPVVVLVGVSYDRIHDIEIA